MGYVRVVVSKHHLLPMKVDPTWSLTTFVAYPTGGLTIPNGLQGCAQTVIDDLIMVLIERTLTRKLLKQFSKKRYD